MLDRGWGRRNDIGVTVSTSKHCPAQGDSIHFHVPRKPLLSGLLRLVVAGKPDRLPLSNLDVILHEKSIYSSIFCLRTCYLFGS